ncbi:MAG: hypothetical protein P8H59_05375 [Flavobacteriales bacterium]|nr:hypothetical protein [Flavobacteriales bacterium]MDG1780361.1 hypothetical protein [Flavobacteriales bacterium]MDG2246557.1 hypothetical protein [Flavobacteriales bacterium]
MDTVLDFIFPLIPALLVFVTAYIFFNNMRKDQRDFQTAQIKIELLKQSLPLQLKAYERLTIMLERITPSNLVMRINRGSMNGSQLQLELLKAIREEYEHNISMQVYVSDGAWEMTRIAKEETLQLIKIAATKVGPEGSSMQLSKEIFDLENKTGNSAIKQAIKALRNEARGKMMQS